MSQCFNKKKIENTPPVRVLLVLLDHLDLVAHQVFKDPLVKEENKERRVTPVPPAQMVVMDKMVLQDPR